VRITEKIENNIVTDMAAGDEFSIIVSKNKGNEETEVFGCGYNIHGELGTGYLKHVADI
jgi:hypothetical protein